MHVLGQITRLESISYSENLARFPEFSKKTLPRVV